MRSGDRGSARVASRRIRRRRSAAAVESPPAIRPSDFAGQDHAPDGRAAEALLRHHRPEDVPTRPTAALTNANWTTIAQSQARPELSPAVVELREHVGPPCRSAAGRRIAAADAAATRNVAASTRDRHPGARRRDDQTAERGAADQLAFMPSRRIAFAPLQEPAGRSAGRFPTTPGRRTRCRVRSRARGRVDARAAPHPLSRSMASAAWLAPLTQFETTMTRWRGSLSAQTPPTAGRRAGAPAAPRARSRGRLRPGQLKHGERERDGRHRIAEHRDEPREEEKAELALAERAERLSHASAASAGAGSSRRTARTLGTRRTTAIVMRRSRPLRSRARSRSRCAPPPARRSRTRPAGRSSRPSSCRRSRARACRGRSSLQRRVPDDRPVREREPASTRGAADRERRGSQREQHALDRRDGEERADYEHRAARLKRSPASPRQRADPFAR